MKGGNTASVTREVQRVARCAEEYVRKQGSGVAVEELRSALEPDARLISRAVTYLVQCGRARREGRTVHLLGGT